MFSYCISALPSRVDIPECTLLISNRVKPEEHLGNGVSNWYTARMS